MARVRMYSTRVCPYCIRAEKLLAKKGVADDQIEKIRVDEFPERREEMMRITGQRSVPQIFIGTYLCATFERRSKKRIEV